MVVIGVKVYFLTGSLHCRGWALGYRPPANFTLVFDHSQLRLWVRGFGETTRGRHTVDTSGPGQSTPTDSSCLRLSDTIPCLHLRFVSLIDTLT